MENQAVNLVGNPPISELQIELTKIQKAVHEKYATHLKCHEELVRTNAPDTALYVQGKRDAYADIVRLVFAAVSDLYKV